MLKNSLRPKKSQKSLVLMLIENVCATVRKAALRTTSHKRTILHIICRLRRPYLVFSHSLIHTGNLMKGCNGIRVAISGVF